MKKQWKRNYGDNEPTLDSVLWINGSPTTSSVSQYGGVYIAYANNKKIGMYDTLKEAKESILNIKEL